MTIDFHKYQGTGNDFVLIDDRATSGRATSGRATSGRAGAFPATNQTLVERLCHRRFGIGADGLILLQDDPEYDFRMVYFNADGAEGSMCGNGGRCLVRFAHDLGLFERETRFRAIDGEHSAVVCEEDIFLKMSDVPGIEDRAAPGRAGLTFVDTGSPHVVRFVDDLELLDVVAEGRAIRYDERFQPNQSTPGASTPGASTRGGTNVNFAQVLDDHTLFVRTYERGVEDETYSCGTGVTAVALVACQQLAMPDPVFIQTLGGNLRVSFAAQPDGRFNNIYLIGPAKRVFTGQISL